MGSAEKIANAIGKLEKSINGLVFDIRNLRQSVDKASESSNSLQKKLVFWTMVMAGAIIAQILTIIITIISR